MTLSSRPVRLPRLAAALILAATLAPSGCLRAGPPTLEEVDAVNAVPRANGWEAVSGVPVLFRVTTNARKVSFFLVPVGQTAAEPAWQQSGAAPRFEFRWVPPDGGGAYTFWVVAEGARGATARSQPIRVQVVTADQVETGDAGTTSYVYAYDFATGTSRPLFEATGRVLALGPSPDGARLAYLVAAAAPGEPEGAGALLVRDLAAGQTYPVGPDTLFAAVTDLRTAWSPDGRHILYVATAPDPSGMEVWQARWDGTDARRLLSPEHGGNILKAANPTLSPDGRMLAFRTFGDFRSRVFLARPAGSESKQLGDFDVPCCDIMYQPLIFSPDGKNLLSLELEPLALWLFPVAGGKERLVAGVEPAWRPASDSFAYVPVVDGAAAEIRLYDLATRRERTLYRAPGGDTVLFGLAWRPDGEVLAFLSMTGDQTSVLLVGADGSLLQRSIAGVEPPGLAWSPDGKTLYHIRGSEDR